MKNVWKWIIGTAVGLVVLAALLGAGFILRNSCHVYRTGARIAPGFYQRGPGMMPFGGFEHMRAPGMMGRGIMPFGGFIGGLVSLGFLVLVVLGIIWLVRSLRKPLPVVDVPAAMPEPIPAAVVNPCKKCGRPLEADWNVCPHCGKKVPMVRATIR